jgi:Flavin containing amine oxidoreductase
LGAQVRPQSIVTEQRLTHYSKGDNPIVKLAQETDTPLHVWKENTLMLDGDGRPVDPDLANRALKRVWDILELALEHSRSDSANLDPHLSLYDEFTAVTRAQMEKGEISNYERELVLGMAQMWGAYVGDSVDRQSMKFFFLEDCIEGDDCFIATNYKKIMARITAVPREKAHIRYNTVMSSTVAQPDGGVCIITADGEEMRFDDVVITAPLGYLKRHKSSIEPLEESVAHAIDQISYGRLEKVLVEFPSSFWESEEHVTKEDEGGISFVHWLAPSYAPETNPHKWRLEVVSFNAFDAPYRRNILLFYTFGDCSTHITASIRGLKGASRHDWLQRFFEPYYSRLPNYDPKTCAPLRFLATEWANDEFSGFGSYCNFQVGMQDAARDVKAIRYGMPDRHIYFAGEHTAPFDGLGTVAGAYKSGDAVARRIITCSQLP